MLGNKVALRQDKVFRSLQEHSEILLAELKQIDQDIIIQQKMVNKYNADGFERGVSRLQHIKEQKTFAYQRVQLQLSKLESSLSSQKKLSEDLHNITVREQMHEARKRERELEKRKLEMENHGKYDEALMNGSPTITDHLNASDITRLEDIENPVIYKKIQRPLFVESPITRKTSPKNLDNPFVNRSPILQHKAKSQMQHHGRQKFNVSLYDMS
jgi:hypothetical protein